MIKAEYQAWKNGILIHEYKTFDREKALAEGQNKAVERYDYILNKFQKLSIEERKNGLIYGGTEYDFFFIEEE